MKRENYYIIQGWMVVDLKLSGNNLILYAIIYGFSQDSESKCHSSLGTLADWMTASKSTVQRGLKELEEMGLLNKHVEVKNGVTFNSYSANKTPIQNDYPQVKSNEGGIVKMNRGYSQNEQGGIVKMTTNKYVLNNDKYIIPNTEVNPDVETKKFEDYPLPRMMKVWMQHFPKYHPSISADYQALAQIFQSIQKKQVADVPIAELEEFVKKFAKSVALHNFYKDKPLKTIANNLQSIIPIYNDPKGYLDERAKPKQEAVLTDVKIVLNGGVTGYNESKGVKIKL
jgi:hypothetical protein